MKCSNQDFVPVGCDAASFCYRIPTFKGNLVVSSLRTQISLFMNIQTLETRLLHCLEDVITQWIRVVISETGNELSRCGSCSSVTTVTGLLSCNIHAVMHVMYDNTVSAGNWCQVKVCYSITPTNNPYPTAFPYGNGMVLHFYQQQESSKTKTVHKVINKGLKTYV